MSGNKSYSNIIVIITLLVLTCFNCYATDIKVMSFNVRYANNYDGINSWDNRKEPLINLIKRNTPEIVGLQECLHQQIKTIDSSLSNYSYIGIGRDDGATKGEYSPILYDTNKYELISHSTFWLSPTPNSITVGWDASMERICTWGKLQRKSDGLKIIVFNTHFDHLGEKARLESSNLIMKTIDNMCDSTDRIVLMGDFNCDINSMPIKVILGSFKTVHNHISPRGTFNGFDNDMTINKRIDFIFVKNLSISNYIHINDRRPNGDFISDHLPVMAILNDNN